MAAHSRWFCTSMLLVVMSIRVVGADVEEFNRVRSESSRLRMVVATTFARSATFQSLVNRIEQSDVIVYLTCHHFGSATLIGQTALISARPGVRYLLVQVLCQQPDQMLVAILAHELQHVVEIAATPSVVDDQSFARLFSAIGFRTCFSSRREQFETMAAIDIGNRVRTEHMPQSRR